MATAACSRQECIDRSGAPTSTVATPSRAAVSGPMVDPQGRSARVTKCCSPTPAARQQAANQPPVPASGHHGLVRELSDDAIDAFVGAAGPWVDRVRLADVNGDGRLDLLALSDGSAVAGINQSQKNYHWQVVRPRAVQATGDQRINSFGVGGEMEVRSGLLVQKQAITGPVLHFGLGEGTSTDVIRVVWPNGSVRADFEVDADQTVVTEQRLKGSCPFLFAWNGQQMEFVKDTVPWGSAIGLRINTLGTARVEATEEWFKIGGDQLVARDGYYDLRITAELWETYYYDQLSLMVVDHPPGTQIFVDERFVIPPAKLAITTVSTPRPIASAIDDNGQDVTSAVNALDGNYLDTFGRGRYQGVTRDHYVEIDLGEGEPVRRCGPQERVRGVVELERRRRHYADFLKVSRDEGPFMLPFFVNELNGKWGYVRDYRLNPAASDMVLDEVWLAAEAPKKKV